MNELAENLGSLLGDKIAHSEIRLGELTLTVPRQHLVDVVTLLRDDPQCQFKSFIDLCGVDYPARVDRFDVVVHLLSPYLNQRIRVKVSTNEDDPVPSITGVFPGPTGSNAKPTISTESCSRAIRTCVVS